MAPFTPPSTTISPSLTGLASSTNKTFVDTGLACGGVLVVEDSPLQKANLCNWLRTFGLPDIYTSGDGHHALELVRNLPKPPCLLILDLELPGMDGIELLQRLHELQILPAVLVMSSADDVLLNVVATMADAMGFPLLGTLRKPFVPADLLTALERVQHPLGVSAPLAPASEPSLDQLRLALKQGAVQPYFQPKVDIQVGRLAGVEALARWEHNNQFVAPNVFIAQAEHHGLIEQLTLVMLEQVLNHMANWRARGAPLPVAINLSASSLGNREFANDVLAMVARYREDPHLITFEITESAFVMDLPAALASISRLRLKGFGFSIDDYGTGFSSMQQLSRFPFTELKIDRSFVQGAADRPSLKAILQSAVDVGRRLGITTVAEGVERLEDLRLLRHIGCRQAQGFGLAKPMPAAALSEWLREPLQEALALCRS